MEGQRIFSLATSSADGIPNVVPVGFLFEGRDGSIWVIDNYMKKTLANVRENPKASFYIWQEGAKESYQVKCSVTVETSGEDYELAKEIAHKKREEFPAKTLLKLKPEEVYSVTPGPGAGRKL